MFNPFGNYDPQIKIIIFSVFTAFVFVVVVLGIVLCSIWAIEARKTRRNIRQYKAEIIAENNVARQNMLRRQKEREARKTLSDDTFTRQLQEIFRA